MRQSDDVRSLMQTVGSAALGIGIGMGILIAGFVVSNITLSNAATVATTINSPSALATTTPRATTVATQPAATTPTGTLAARTATPTPAPTVPPTPTPDPMVVTAYSGQGIRLAALTIPAGYTVNSPIAGRVSIVMYQFVDGEIRTGVDGVPSYPYIFVRSADREVKLRPGATGRDIQLLVKDGDTVGAGTPLFKTVTSGASSWKTFYDGNQAAQVMVSVTAQPSGAEVDPVPLFKR